MFQYPVRYAPKKKNIFKSRNEADSEQTLKRKMKQENRDKKPAEKSQKKLNKIPCEPRSQRVCFLFFVFIFLAEEHFELRVYELISAHFDLGSSSAGLVGGGGDAGSGFDCGCGCCSGRTKDLAASQQHQVCV